MIYRFPYFFPCDMLGVQSSDVSAVACTYQMVSELLTLDGDWIPGPESPFDLGGMGDYPNGICAVQLNSTHTMLTGKNEKEKYLFNIQTILRPII